MQSTEDAFQNDEIETVTMPHKQGIAERIGANPLVIPGSILIGAFIIGMSLIIGLSAQGGGGGSPAAGLGAAAQAVDVKDVDIEGTPYIGNPNAPVTLVYWSDYQCPFCKAFEVGGVPQINQKIPVAMPDIIKTYVDTGKVKIVFKEFPFLGEDSITAAEYAYAIWELYPAQFYNWRVAMLTAQDDEGDEGFGDAASIDAMLKSKFPQLDVNKIKARIASEKERYREEMNADKAEGQSMGITGTPGFITGKVLIGGDAPFPSFKAAIDPQLK